MKHIRRTAALLLTLVTLAAMLSVSVSAKQANLTDHDYKIYQVFKAEKTENGTIEGVTWGSAVSGNGYNYSAALIQALAQVNGFSGLDETAEAKDVAAKLDLRADGHKVAYSFAQAVYEVIKNSPGAADYDKNEGYEPGYYLIVDTTDLGNEKDSARNAPVLQLTDKPQGEALKIENKTNIPDLKKQVKNIDSNDENWSHSASYAVGDKVMFRLKCTMGDMLGYSRYFLKFVDQPSQAFQIDTSSLKVYYTDENGEQDLDERQDETGYWWNYTEDSSTRELTITFENVMACGVTAGDIVTVEYEATFDPGDYTGSHANTAYVEYSRDPLNPDDHGRTTPQTNNVHTFTVIVNKVDGNDQPLPGAMFELAMKNGSGGYEVVDALVVEESGTRFKWEGLKAGDYRLTEINAPSDEYKKIDPVEFTIKPVYYDGNYTMLDSLTVTYTDPEKNNGSVFKADKETREITATIRNVTGATLPETGGRGTRMFYIAGSVLFLGGAILLVTKRRMYDPE